MPSKSQQLRVYGPSSPATIGTKNAMWTAQSCVQDGKTARAKSLSLVFEMCETKKPTSGNKFNKFCNFCEKWGDDQKHLNYLRPYREAFALIDHCHSHQLTLNFNISRSSDTANNRFRRDNHGCSPAWKTWLVLSKATFLGRFSRISESLLLTVKQCWTLHKTVNSCKPRDFLCWLWNSVSLRILAGFESWVQRLGLLQ